MSVLHFSGCESGYFLMHGILGWPIFEGSPLHCLLCSPSYYLKGFTWFEFSYCTFTGLVIWLTLIIPFLFWCNQNSYDVSCSCSCWVYHCFEESSRCFWDYFLTFKYFSLAVWESGFFIRKEFFGLKSCNYHVLHDYCLNFACMAALIQSSSSLSFFHSTAAHLLTQFVLKNFAICASKPAYTHLMA